MNYETMYQLAQNLERSLKETCAAMTKYQKAQEKDLVKGDLKNLIRNLQGFEQAYSQCGNLLNSLQDEIASFDVHTYLANGDFAQQLVAQCEQEGVDVVGTFPLYEMFPFRVRIDSENEELFLDRKKVSCLRPESFVDMVKRSQEKMMKGSFNVNQFLNELSMAYDLAVIKLGKKSDADIYLNTLYKFLVPMSRSRREYDQQNYAFDLARLYMAEPVLTKDGRTYQFGPSRNNSKAIRILDRQNREQFLATIRFFK